MKFGAIIIGDEILSGKRKDQHLSKVIELLGAKGLQLAYAEYLGDDPDRITAALQRAFASGDVLFSFGGIGSTPDDHTRQCAARALDVPLVLHPEAEALITERMREMAAQKGEALDPTSEVHQHRLNMGRFPLGADIIPNSYNKIPGFRCAGPAGGHVHFVPGFPVMAWPMVEWVLNTHYAHCFVQGAWLEKSVILQGAMEAALTPLMQQLEQRHPVRVFSLPSVDHPQWGRHVELGVKGTPAEVETAFSEMVQMLQAAQCPICTELVRNH
ncbi:competence/damage-inducible protein A [Curvibacter sp. CHRR-16]|uniref:competence/damage-inducible protein A n=1 Tax=Curvibacter sp. CHRR-16 TaxID=2835872 RepID=UPI001BDA83BE|nr:molybdopterin-binding protein [Curvibacter sp. CHRR-16]MBT0569043.1 competence/damage-inducible protein A [Curvibacter sp. CHRR-16]